MLEHGTPSSETEEQEEQVAAGSFEVGLIFRSWSRHVDPRERVLVVVQSL